MASYISHISKPSILAVWCVMLAAALWTLSAVGSPVALLGMVLIGLTPAVVLFILARRPALTTAEAVQAVYAGRAE